MLKFMVLVYKSTELFLIILCHRDNPNLLPSLLNFDPCLHYLLKKMKDFLLSYKKK